jgi:hypothetical protein
MTDGFSGVESALNLSQSKAEHVSHSYSYSLRVVTPLCGKGGVLCILNVMGITTNTYRNSVVVTKLSNEKGIAFNFVDHTMLVIYPAGPVA